MRHFEDLQRDDIVYVVHDNRLCQAKVKKCCLFVRDLVKLREYNRPTSNSLVFEVELPNGVYLQNSNIHLEIYDTIDDFYERKVMSFNFYDKESLASIAAEYLADVSVTDDKYIRARYWHFCNARPDYLCAKYVFDLLEKCVWLLIHNYDSRADVFYTREEAKEISVYFTENECRIGEEQPILTF